MPWPEDSHRDRLRRYTIDMAVSVATSTHKDRIDKEPDPYDFRRLIHDVAQLAAHIAIEKYESDHRIIIAQADSFINAAAERNATRMPMALDAETFKLLMKGADPKNFGLKTEDLK